VSLERAGYPQAANAYRPPVLVDPSLDRPLHKQLADLIRTQIQTGELAPGQRLPAQKDYAQEHGLSRYTVERAINALRHEGLIVTTRRGLAFGAGRLPRRCTGAKERSRPACPPSPNVVHTGSKKASPSSSSGTTDRETKFIRLMKSKSRLSKTNPSFLNPARRKRKSGVSNSLSPSRKTSTTEGSQQWPLLKLQSPTISASTCTFRAATSKS
jgi:DNA-binding transcriptional MocR family regulator